MNQYRKGEDVLGRVSLWTAIVGVLLPSLIALLASKLKALGGNAFLACWLLFVALELVALIAGAKSRRTPFGIAGLAICAVVLAVSAIIVAPLTLAFP
jgi:hypothetical protein